MNKTVSLTTVLLPLMLPLVLSTAAIAKLAPPSDEAKAKASETAARTAWSGKVGAYQLCQTQNRIAAGYRSSMKNAASTNPAASASASLSASAAATANAAISAPCADPGPFVYVADGTSPPLEAAGAHSPAKTAVAPPSSLQTEAEKKPAAQDGGKIAVKNGDKAAAKDGGTPPLEASGAHSPPKTATAPPSSKQTEAEKKPAPK